MKVDLIPSILFRLRCILLILQYSFGHWYATQRVPVYTPNDQLLTRYTLKVMNLSLLSNSYDISENIFL